MSTTTSNSLHGKTVLITGASSGIGEATATLLAQRGANVVIGARRGERLQALEQAITASGGSVRHRLLDVTDAADVAAFVAYAQQQFGRVDVLVNNAGVMPLSPLSALKLDEWNRMIDVNIRGVLHGIAAILPVMQAQGSGQVINVASL
ncbi:MAG: SDR family oxidoreductase, partial [Lysobacter sp.]|nr:SDR family oxidoreductase [Lysobacter sp.]